MLSGKMKEYILLSDPKAENEDFGKLYRLLDEIETKLIIKD